MTLADPITSERDYTDLEREWLVAVETYRSTQRRRFPTACELLAVLHALGYRKVAPPLPLPQFSRRSCRSRLQHSP